MKIVLSTVVALFLFGCSENTQHSEQTNQKQATAETKVAAQAQEKSEVKHEKVLKQAQVQKELKELDKKLQKEALEIPPIATEVVQEDLAVVQQKMKAANIPEPKKIKSEQTAQVEKMVDARTLFNACAACHGKNAQNKALGKSQVIKGWSSAKIEKALHGYKNGSYGGAMKAIMKGQASKLSDAQIKALAAYISKL